MKHIAFIFFYAVALFSSERYSLENENFSKNFYYTSEHFQVIIGTSYKDNLQVRLFAEKLLDAAETSWQKEIVTLGFTPPRNSDVYKIDIYIANRSAVNLETGMYETISAGYAGWAMSYEADNTPYFLINPVLTDKQLQVTISHEFFHAIQYALFNEKAVSDTKWFQNIWWLEATAVLMEDEVYDSLNDYVVFLSPFFEASYKSFEIYDGSHEYAMVIFAKYIKEKFGMQLIKDSLARLDKSSESDGYFEILDSLLEDEYSSSMFDELNDFAKWVSNASVYFEEGALYPSLKHFTSNDAVSIGKGGVLITDNLVEGWNMVSVTSSEFSRLDIKNFDSIWSYKDDTWYTNLDNTIADTNISNGYWVKVSTPSSLYYTYFDVDENNVANIDNNWNLLGTSKNILIADFDLQDILVWQYKNNEWYVYSNNTEIQKIIVDLEYKQLENIAAYSSYWIKKL